MNIKAVLKDVKRHNNSANDSKIKSCAEVLLNRHVISSNDLKAFYWIMRRICKWSTVWYNLSDIAGQADTSMLRSYHTLQHLESHGLVSLHHGVKKVKRGKRYNEIIPREPLIRLLKSQSLAVKQGERKHDKRPSKSVKHRASTSTHVYVDPEIDFSKLDNSYQRVFALVASNLHHIPSRYCKVPNRQAGTILGISKSTANNMMRKLAKHGLLTIGGTSRSHYLEFTPLGHKIAQEHDYYHNINKPSDKGRAGHRQAEQYTDKLSLKQLSPAQLKVLDILHSAIGDTADRSHATRLSNMDIANQAHVSVSYASNVVKMFKQYVVIGTLGHSSDRKIYLTSLGVKTIHALDKERNDQAVSYNHMSVRVSNSLPEVQSQVFSAILSTMDGATGSTSIRNRDIYKLIDNKRCNVPESITGLEKKHLLLVKGNSRTGRKMMLTPKGRHMAKNLPARDKASSAASQPKKAVYKMSYKPASSANAERSKAPSHASESAKAKKEYAHADKITQESRHVPLNDIHSINLSDFQEVNVHAPVYDYEMVFTNIRKVSEDGPVSAKDIDEIELSGNRFNEYLNGHDNVQLLANKVHPNILVMRHCQADLHDPSVVQLVRRGKHLRIWSTKLAERFNKDVTDKMTTKNLYVYGKRIGNVIVFDLSDIKQYYE